MKLPVWSSDWRSLPDAFQRWVRLDPPRGAGIDERADNFRNALGLLASRRTAADDFERALALTVFRDIVANLADIVGRKRMPVPEFLRNDAVPSQGAAHGFRFVPHTNDPNGNSRLVHRSWNHNHVIDAIVLA